MHTDSHIEENASEKYKSEKLREHGNETRVNNITAESSCKKREERDEIAIVTDENPFNHAEIWL